MGEEAMTQHILDIAANHYTAVNRDRQEEQPLKDILIHNYAEHGIVATDVTYHLIVAWEVFEANGSAPEWLLVKARGLQVHFATETDLTAARLLL